MVIFEEFIDVGWREIHLCPWAMVLFGGNCQNSRRTRRPIRHRGPKHDLQIWIGPVQLRFPGDGGGGAVGIYVRILSNR